MSSRRSDTVRDKDDDGCTAILPILQFKPYMEIFVLRLVSALDHYLYVFALIDCLHHGVSYEGEVR